MNLPGFRTGPPCGKLVWTRNRAARSAPGGGAWIGDLEES